jgi:hypothetical protein
MANKKNNLSSQEAEGQVPLLRERFEANMERHNDVAWKRVDKRLKENPGKLWSIRQMELSGGEPDVVGENVLTGEILFYDCSKESPVGRRSICYDPVALASRKENKPANSALGMAAEMEIEILTEEDYRYLQQLGKFDLKTSSWVETPSAIRALGGALFCDRRYDTVFLYHNGAESYYAARGFRGKVWV